MILSKNCLTLFEQYSESEINQKISKADIDQLIKLKEVNDRFSVAHYEQLKLLNKMREALIARYQPYLHLRKIINKNLMNKATVTIKDFLTDEQIEQCKKIYKEVPDHNRASTISKEVMEPNMPEINQKIGQENDPKFLAYLVCAIISKAYTSPAFKT